VAILLYSLAGLGLLAGGIWGFIAGVEWWAGLILIGAGLGSIAIALYKLDEETNCFTDARARGKARKVRKITDGKYKIKPLNMVPMLIRAYDERKEYGESYITKRALRCILSGYGAMRKNWKFVAKECPEQVANLDVSTTENLLFTTLSNLLTAFVAIDGCVDAEYQVYRKFCKRANKDFTPLSKTELQEKCNHLLTKNEEGVLRLHHSTRFIRGVCRGCISSNAYEEFVMGFCYLTLADNIVCEDEYVLLETVFFDPELDRYPKTWEQFKKEYQ